MNAETKYSSHSGDTKNTDAGTGVNSRAWAILFGIIIAGLLAWLTVYWWHHTSSSTRDMRQRIDKLQQQVDTLENRLEDAERTPIESNQIK